MLVAKINAQSVLNIFVFMMFFISYIFYRYFFNQVVVNSFFVRRRHYQVIPCGESLRTFISTPGVLGSFRLIVPIL